MDIYTYLQKDHRRVSDLMEEVLMIRNPQLRREIFEEIYQELTLHSEAEDATFYKALAQMGTIDEKIEEARDDHEEITDYLDRLSSIEPDTEKWIALFGEFKHAVEHHVKDEETRIFKKARMLLDDKKAEQLAKDMARLKGKAMIAA